MKRIIYSVAIALICGGWIFGKYSSMAEAEIACDKWQAKGKILLRKKLELPSTKLELFDCSKYPGTISDCRQSNSFINRANAAPEKARTANNVYTRRCNLERETRKYLGLERYFENIDAGGYVGDQEGIWSIKKRFRY